jgi:hypothetical protein
LTISGGGKEEKMATNSGYKESVITRLNELLKQEKKLDLPSFRKEVTIQGKNIKWLHKNLKKRNDNCNPEIYKLLSSLVSM